MGRGRQKAKQAKVARRLKYYSPETNYRELEQELAAQKSSGESSSDSSDSDDDALEEYARWAAGADD